MKLDYLPKSLRIHWFFKVLFIAILLILIWVIFYYGIPKIVPTQRIESQEIYGLIFADQIWGGDIKIVGDIYSLTNNKITILPGTKIKVAINGDKSNMDLLPWHRKSGVNTEGAYKGVNVGEPFWDETEKVQIHLNELEIIGEPSNPVVVSADSESPSPFDFNILNIKSGLITHAIFSDYRRFEIGSDVLISNSVFKNVGECSLCVGLASPKIENNTFESSLRESIWVERGSPKINNNLFVNLDGVGIKIDARRLSVPEITNNVFEMPQGTALNIVSGGQSQEALIARNIFAGSTVAQIACDFKVKIRDNIILGRIGFSNGCDGSFVFGPNYWGTPDPRSVMSEKILSKDTKFKVSIPDVLILAPKDAGRK